ncbi:hypothetical protein AB0O75_46725 [Streptomyces sp. NPDC088921]|uniref:hypothetical protein n=1 Tax=unclassified Streptomyces TaxID=2593676 RepID=UPI0034184CD6
MPAGLGMWFGRLRRGGNDSDAQVEVEEETRATAEEEALRPVSEGYGPPGAEEADDAEGNPDDGTSAHGSRPRVSVKVAGTAALLGAALLTTPFLMTQGGDADHTARNAAGARPNAAVGPDGLAPPGVPTTPAAPNLPSAPSHKATTGHQPTKAAGGVAKKPAENSARETDKTGHKATSAPTGVAKSSKPTSKSTTKPIATAVPSSLNIPAGKSLAQGQSWRTDRITVTMQTDGNFVVYNAAHKGLWSTRTNGYGYRAKMNSDGNFVIYDTAGDDIWDTGTSGHSGAYFRLGHDGNVMVVYQGHAIWNAGTKVV